MFIRRLMKVAVTVVFVVPLLFCRDFFVAGGICINYIIANHHILPDVLLFDIALRALAFFAISLISTYWLLRMLLRIHAAIDRLVERWVK